MRTFPKLRPPAASRKATTTFGGYNHNPVIGDNEFFDMENMTGDLYPVASVRKARSAYEDIGGSTMERTVALHHRDDWPIVCYDFGSIGCNGHLIDGILQTEQRYRATETHKPQLGVKLDEAQFIAKVEQTEGEYNFYREPYGWTDDDDNRVTLSEYGIRAFNDKQGDVITVTVELVEDTIPEALLPKQMVSMGAWVLIWPDKVFVNAVKLGNGNTMVEGMDYGHIDNSVSIVSPEGAGEPVFYVRPCEEDGTAVVAKGYGKTSDIANPEDGDYCCDLEERQWYKYTESNDEGVWLPVRLYASLEADGIAAGFRKDDYIRIEKAFGIEPIKERGSDELSDGNYRRIVDTVGEDKIILDAFFTGTYEQARDWESEQDICTISRDVPQLDYIVECGNRLWGCFYGEKDGEHINEIYACKLGDFRNWNCFAGISTDSYVASRGADGKYTGAAVLNGNPLFFRENSFEKVYPSAGGAHQITTVNYPGIQDGSWQSVAVIEGTLFYKGVDGIYAYTGSVPRMISEALGSERYFDAVAAPCNRKYYVSMRDSSFGWTLFVFDSAKGLWLKEDNTRFESACEYNGCLYYISDEFHPWWKIGGVDVSTNVPWMIESGDIGLTMPDQKRISRIVLRLKLELGAEARIFVQYDSDGRWHEKMHLHGNGLRSMIAPIVPIRCDHMKIRMSGEGGMDLYSMAYTLEQGSDLP